MKRPSAAAQKRHTAIFILSIVLVASMVCSFVVMVRPPTAPATQPTPAVPRAAPTPKPTTAPNAQPATAAPPTRQADPTITSSVPVTSTLGLPSLTATPVVMRGTRDPDNRFTWAHQHSAGSLA